MLILGIETSCDETAAAVVRGQRGRVEILSNAVASQIDIHKKYGGVVPEVAAREHVLNILPVIKEALTGAGIKLNQAPKKLKAIAVTIGPGLITSLQVGVETAKALAYVWRLPVVGLNHIEAHIYANFIYDSKQNSKQIKFPAVILTVSGGHTILVLMRGHGRYKIIGQTRDDAAGEAFDKAAKLLGLGYPGGPAIATAAEEINIQSRTSRAVRGKYPISNIQFPRPMLNSQNFDFSFSGLKTALRYALAKDKNWRDKISTYAAEFQEAVVDVLVAKTIRAAKIYQAKTIMLAGGVSANQCLREKMTQTIKTKLPNIYFSLPDLDYTTDNAAMVATAGYFKARQNRFTPWPNLKADCNLGF
jgi:N6-L-threonylcarbamoyladenine synthase